MQVNITGQDHQGRGVARKEGKVIFVEGALPGEVCEIEVKKEKKQYQEARVIEKIVSKSVPSPCCYYPLCGGCALLHQAYPDQLAWKEKKVKELLEKFAGITPRMMPILSDEQFHYRNKLTLHHLGLYQKKTHQDLKIEACLLVDPKINEILKRLKDYQRNTHEKIKEAMIRTTTQGETSLSLTGEIQIEKIKEEFSDITCLLVNGNFLTEKKTIKDKLCNHLFLLSPESFYQVNRFLTEKLYQEIVSVFKDLSHQHVLDLYCGVGTISLIVSHYVRHVTGIEIVKEAIENANQNKQLNNITNVDFICGKVEDYIDHFQEVDAIIVDPPRSGLDSKTINHILKIAPQTLVYVSCDPVTLSRDLNILKEKYNVVSVRPVDMFPNTHHVECVSVLHLKETEKH